MHMARVGEGEEEEKGDEAVKKEGEEGEEEGGEGRIED